MYWQYASSEEAQDIRGEGPSEGNSKVCQGTVSSRQHIHAPPNPPPF